VIDRSAAYNRALRESPTAERARLAVLAAESTIPANDRLERSLHPWTAYVIVPLFAFANAGVALDPAALGTAFAYPKRHTNCLLVAEGHGAAPLYFLAQELLARHKRVDMIVGAEDMDRVFKPIEGKRLSQTIAIVTADGSLGERGSVMDVLAEMVEGTSTEVLYAAAPSPTLARIAAFCAERAIPAQVAVEERMACGLGLCQTCVVPVARKDGSGYDLLRSCVDGPVFNPARVVWDRWISDAPTMLPTPPEGLPVVRSWPG